VSITKNNLLSVTRWAGIYVLNMIAATLGAWFAAKIFGETLLAPIVGSKNLSAGLLEPPYPILIAFGILAGYVSRIRWKGSQALWVWIPPAVYLGAGIVLWLRAGFHVGDAFDHFFGLGCYPLCEDQYERTVPLYTSLAYSLGAFSNQRRSRQRARRDDGLYDPNDQTSGEK
jgi:hypothetical protein